MVVPGDREQGWNYKHYFSYSLSCCWDIHKYFFSYLAVRKGLCQKIVILLIQMPILFSLPMHYSSILLMLNEGQGRPLAHKWFYTFSDSPWVQPCRLPFGCDCPVYPMLRWSSYWRTAYAGSWPVGRGLGELISFIFKKKNCMVWFGKKHTS